MLLAGEAVQNADEILAQVRATLTKAESREGQERGLGEDGLGVTAGNFATVGSKEPPVVYSALLEKQQRRRNSQIHSRASITPRGKGAAAFAIAAVNPESWSSSRARVP
jgi:hypothetical protein